MPSPTAPADVPAAASVVMPALRWDGSAYLPHDDSAGAAELLAAGVAGFILFGGTVDAVRELTVALRAEAGRPLLFGADLERGAGQQFAGATPLPPAGALGSLEDLAATRNAGELTAREAWTLGIDLVFAPVADVSAEPENPIVGPRAFSSDPLVAAEHVRAWVEGARAGGAHPCVKHFPGHGRTRGDTHVGGVRIDADRETLLSDLAPVRAAIGARVPLVMPGHLAAPPLDPEGRIATVSPPMLQGLLRDELGFGGVVVSDALLMGGAGELRETAVAALRAGVDLLLYPADPMVAITALARAADSDVEVAARLAEASARVGALARRHGEPGEVGRSVDRASAARWASDAVVRLRGEGAPPGVRAAIRVVDVDDDLGGPYPVPSREPFRRAIGHDPDGHTTVVALWADTRGWKGRAGLSGEKRAELASAIAAAGDDAHVVVFGGPRVVEDVPPGPTVWLAWGGEALMQRAAGERLRSARGGR